MCHYKIGVICYTYYEYIITILKIEKFNVFNQHVSNPSSAIYSKCRN